MDNVAIVWLIVVCHDDKRNSKGAVHKVRRASGVGRGIKKVSQFITEEGV